MQAKKRLVIFSALLLATTILTATFFVFFLKPKKTVLVSPLAPSDSKTIGFNQLPSKINNAYTNSYLSEGKNFNILLLGLDGRRGDKRPRCDAVHMFSVDLEKENILITTVPRGTIVDLPGVEKASSYLGNSCHIMGIDFAVANIEKITGLHADYVAKVGFSQTLGILRTLGLPTTPTLQFLRNRRFGLGDYQRSHNQALFIKDMITTHLEKVGSIPKPVKYLLYKMIDTNMPYELADSLLEQILARGIHKDEGKILLSTKPNSLYKVKELHFQATSFQNQSSFLNDQEFKDYQATISSYLTNLVVRADKLIATNKKDEVYRLVKTPFSQQLWLQLENEGKRDQFHFDLLRLYALTSHDSSNSSLILDFISEMEAVGSLEFKDKGEKLLELAHS